MVIGREGKRHQDRRLARGRQFADTRPCRPSSTTPDRRCCKRRRHILDERHHLSRRARLLESSRQRARMPPRPIWWMNCTDRDSRPIAASSLARAIQRPRTLAAAGDQHRRHRSARLRRDREEFLAHRKAGLTSVTARGKLRAVSGKLTSALRDTNRASLRCVKPGIGVRLHQHHRDRRSSAASITGPAT